MTKYSPVSTFLSFRSKILDYQALVYVFQISLESHSLCLSRPNVTPGHDVSWKSCSFRDDNCK